MTIDLRELAARLRTWGTGMQLAATTSTNTADAAEFARYAREMEDAAVWCVAAAVRLDNAAARMRRAQQARRDLHAVLR